MSGNINIDEGCDFIIKDNILAGNINIGKMKPKWQDLTEEEMDKFTDFVSMKLNLKSWSGCDIADVYEMAVSISKK